LLSVERDNQINTMDYGGLHEFMHTASPHTTEMLNGQTEVQLHPMSFSSIVPLTELHLFNLSISRTQVTSCL